MGGLVSSALPAGGILKCPSWLPDFGIAASDVAGAAYPSISSPAPRSAPSKLLKPPSCRTAPDASPRDRQGGRPLRQGREDVARAAIRAGRRARARRRP